MRPAALLDALEEALARQDDEAAAIVWSELRSSLAIAEQLLHDVEERQVRGADRPDDDTHDDVRDVRELAARTVGRGWALVAPAAPIVQARAAPSRPRRAHHGRPAPRGRGKGARSSGVGLGSALFRPGWTAREVGSAAAAFVAAWRAATGRAIDRSGALREGQLAQEALLGRIGGLQAHGER